MLSVQEGGRNDPAASLWLVIPAWFPRVLVSDESPLVKCLNNYKAIKVHGEFSSLDPRLWNYMYPPCWLGIESCRNTYNCACVLQPSRCFEQPHK